MEHTLYKQTVNYEHQNAHKFGTIIGVLSLFMAFAGLTSAYLVRKGAGQWVDFSMPSYFLTSTILILLSSGTMYVAHTANKKNSKPLLIVGLLFTLLLGTLFCLYQTKGWQQLYDVGIYLEGNPSGSFLFVITGLHVAHVIGGMIFLLIATLRSFYLYKFKTPEESQRWSRHLRRLFAQTRCFSK